MATSATATNFLDFLGVNIRLPYTDTDYVYSQRVLDALNYLGIENVRDFDVPTTTAIKAAYDKLADAGMQFNMQINAPTVTALSTAINNVKAFATAHPGAVVAIEGLNEPNASTTYVDVNGQSLTGQAAALAFMTDMVAMINVIKAEANSPFANVDVYGQSGFNVDDAAPISNYHAYPPAGGAQTPYNSISAFPLSKSEPVVMTELGYSTALTTSGPEGVDENTQAKLLLSTILDGARLGLERVYLYQLFDGRNDPENDEYQKNYGLFDESVDSETNILYSTKASATAIHNLTTILGNDTGPFGLAAFSYSVTGLPASGASFRIDKASGWQDVVLWAEPDNWDQTLDQPISITPTSVTVSFGSMPVTVRIYDPLVSEGFITSYENVTSITVDVTDHPVIVELAAVGGTLGTAGNDTLTGSAAVDTFYGLAGNDTLNGGNGNDQLFGGAGDDILNGGAGRDAMQGGDGNDSYVVGQAGDLVLESLSAGGGTDSVTASLSYELTVAVENLTLATSAGAINGTGNDLNNVITGNGANNILNGHAGKDTLTGGTGSDIFVLDWLETSSANADIITDFVSGTDDIQLSKLAFGSLRAYGVGTLGTSELTFGTAATQSNQYLIYNAATGSLYYDSDGSGAAAQIEIATFSSHPSLVASDFVIF